METLLFLGILNNITLLLALGFLYSVCIRHWDGSTLKGKLIAGVLFGTVAIVGMLFPVRYNSGIIFDGRTILLGVIGLFGGPVSALLAVLMTSALRVWQGGAGMWMGLATIWSAATIGVAFYYLRLRYVGLIRVWPLIGFGFLIHVAMLACGIFLPAEIRWRVLSEIAGPVLLVYPVATMLYSRLIVELEERKRFVEELREAKENLECQVEERTQELQAANQELTAQNEELNALQEELTAQNEEIKAMNEEVFSLNRELEVINADLELRVLQRTSDLTDAYQELAAQHVELEKAQETLVVSEARLKRAQTIAHVGDWEIELASGKVWASEEAFQIYGIAHSTPYLDLPTIQRLVATQDRPKLDLALKQLLERTGPYDVEFKIYRADNGLERSIHSIAEVEFDQKGNPVRIIGVIQDITAQKKAEEALFENEVRRGREIQRDAQLASRVQGALLSVPTRSDHLDIATIYKPFGYVGGDIYFLDWRYKGGVLRGFIADAVGHGLGTALHTASLHVLLREVNERDLPLPDAMRWLNRRTGEYFEEGTFAGALGFELDIQTRQLRWVCAGIPRVWLAAKDVQEAKECPGMCLGISAEETFDLHIVSVDVGDCFYFMTDGLTNLIGTSQALPLRNFPDMLKLLQSLAESGGRQDDATAVCIRVLSLPESLVRHDGWPRVIRFGSYGDYQRLKGEISKILTEVTGLSHSMFEVAVHEALANAMECRDGVPRQHKARVRFNKVGSRLIVRVKTSRIGFAGNAILRRLRSHPEEMFAYGEDASMGRGIPIMLSIADKMIYNSEGTEVLLVWKIRPANGRQKHE